MGGFFFWYCLNVFCYEYYWRDTYYWNIWFIKIGTVFVAILHLNYSIIIRDIHACYEFLFFGAIKFVLDRIVTCEKFLFLHNYVMQFCNHLFWNMCTLINSSVLCVHLFVSKTLILKHFIKNSAFCSHQANDFSGRKLHN